MEFSEEFRRLVEESKFILPVSIRSLPEIDLYMDQLTTFMEEKLKNQRRYPEDKILTKTMINNYSKNQLFPPPVKKKYSQDHLITLLYTYYLKHILSIGDITALLEPMTERYWDNFREERDTDEGDLSMNDIYQRVFSGIDDLLPEFREDIQHQMDRASRSFTDEALSEEERNYLQRFTFISLLGFDVYMKKRLMEMLIDDMDKDK